MNWFKRKKKSEVDPALEFAKFYLAQLVDPRMRKFELDYLIRLLTVLDVRLYYKQIRITPKRLSAIAKQAVEEFTIIAIVTERK